MGIPAGSVPSLPDLGYLGIPAGSGAPWPDLELVNTFILFLRSNMDPCWIWGSLAGTGFFNTGAFFYESTSGDP